MVLLGTYLFIFDDLENLFKDTISFGEHDLALLSLIAIRL